MDKFEKFTEHARLVLRLAQEEAQRFNHSFIGTEHLLLGLVREERRGGRKCWNIWVSSQKVRAGAIHHRPWRPYRAGRGGPDRACQKVMELAVDEGRRLNHHYVGTEHLLLGLIREGDGIAAGVLESLGVTSTSYAHHIQVLSQSGVSRAGATTGIIARRGIWRIWQPWPNPTKPTDTRASKQSCL